MVKIKERDTDYEKKIEDFASKADVVAPKEILSHNKNERKYKGERYRSISLPLSEEEFKMLDELSKAHFRPKNNMIRYAIKFMYDIMKKNNND